MKRKSFVKIGNSRKRKVKLTSILLFVCFGYFVTTFTIQQFKINEYKVKEKYYNDQIAEVNKETKEYKEITKQVKDVEYIESVARENLGLVKPYEKIFIDVNK